LPLTSLVYSIILLVVTPDPAQPAVTLERAQVEETAGEATQDDGSQFCESVGLPLISPMLALPDISIAYNILHIMYSDETGSYVYVHFNRVATSGTVLL